MKKKGKVSLEKKNLWWVLGVLLLFVILYWIISHSQDITPPEIELNADLPSTITEDINLKLSADFSDLDSGFFGNITINTFSDGSKKKNLTFSEESAGITGQAVRTCEDGTNYGSCSTTKPLYCDKGDLVDECTTCGCDVGEECQADETCLVLTCSDGTVYGECSTTKPKYCDNGTLVDNCSICSCGSNLNCNTTSGSCYNATGEEPTEETECSDGTNYGECSIIKPKYCDNGDLINNCGICNCNYDLDCNSISGSCYNATEEAEEGAEEEPTEKTECSDGIPHGGCSTIKPLYCDNGELINKCQQCGCPQGQNCSSSMNTCFSFASNNTIYLKIPKNYIVLNASFNLTGHIYNGTYPISPTIKVEDENSSTPGKPYNWEYNGKFSITEKVSDFSEQINNYLKFCIPDKKGFCLVPVYVHFFDGGILEISNIDIKTEKRVYCEICLTKDGICDTEWTQNDVITTFSQDYLSGNCSYLWETTNHNDASYNIGFRINDISDNVGFSEKNIIINRTIINESYES